MAPFTQSLYVIELMSSHGTIRAADCPSDERSPTKATLITTITTESERRIIMRSSSASVEFYPVPRALKKHTFMNLNTQTKLARHVRVISAPVQASGTTRDLRI
jgi:hypothetical protein